MREILFKAKRKDNGEWVSGGTIVQFLDDGIRSFYMPQFNEKCDCTHDDATDDILGFENCRFYKVNPDTICRYTGRNDKNGNFIWENDVLRGHGNPKDLAKATFGEFYVIDVETLEKVDSVYGWHTEVIPTDALSKCEPFCLPMPLTEFYISRSEYEVIGNIFDNPELLEELAE